MTLGIRQGPWLAIRSVVPCVEFEYNYRNNGANTIATQGGTQAANGDLTANSYMVNVLYDFDTGSKCSSIHRLGFGDGRHQSLRYLFC